jgi:hypothetical protein
MMLIDLALLFFVLLGSKILLGMIAVYLLIPRDPACALCDAETLPLQHRRGTVTILRLFRLQRRWCMECERESLARRRQPSAVPVSYPRPTVSRRAQ